MAKSYMGLLNPATPTKTPPPMLERKGTEELLLDTYKYHLMLIDLAVEKRVEQYSKVAKQT